MRANRRSALKSQFTGITRSAFKSPIGDRRLPIAIKQVHFLLIWTQGINDLLGETFKNDNYISAFISGLCAVFVCDGGGSACRLCLA
jgi:hypothetical protein